VTAAVAFHWFDHAAALEEIRRVLVPGGGLAVVAMVPDWGAASWAHELGTLIAELRPEHPHFDGPRWQDSVRAAGGFTEPREIRVITKQPADPARLLDHVASFSWVAAMPPDERADTLARMQAIIDAGETPEEVSNRAIIGLTSLA
jgi:hypothetical protein